MSEENVEILRRVINAWNQGEPVRALEMAGDDLVVDYSNSISPAEGIYRRKEQALALFADLSEDFDYLQWAPEEIIEVDESTLVVVARIRGRGRGSGVNVEAVAAAVFTISDGEWRGMKMYQSKAEALEAAGLSE